MYRHAGYISLHVLATRWCNLTCPGCYDQFAQLWLSLDQARLLVQRVLDSSLKKYFFDLSGGEVFGHRQWPEFIEIFLGTGAQVQINSNGTLIDQNAAKILKELDTRYPDQLFLSISLDSSNLEINRQIRPGSASDKVIDGMKNLKAVDVRFRGAITLMSINRPTILDTVRFIVNNYTREFILGVLRPVFTMNEAGKGILVKREDILETIAAILALKEEIGPFDMYHTFDAEGKAFCKAGLDRVNFMPDGRVTSCYALNQPEHTVGNIFETQLDDIMAILQEQNGRRDLGCLLCEHQGHRWGKVPEDFKLGESMV